MVKVKGNRRSSDAIEGQGGNLQEAQAFTDMAGSRQIDEGIQDFGATPIYWADAAGHAETGPGECLSILLSMQYAWQWSACTWPPPCKHGVRLSVWSNKWVSKGARG